MYQGHIKRKKLNFLQGKQFGFRVFSVGDSHTGTISARYFKDGKEILISQPDINKRPRKLSPREAARLQGFPDGVIVNAVSISQIHKQFGNSVSVPVVEAVATSLLKALKKISAPLPG